MAQQRENRRKSSLAFPYEPDSERGHFIQFMDENGISQIFTEIFDTLYNEPIKPENPIQWIRDYLWSRATTKSSEDMRVEIEQLRKEIIHVATKIEHVKRRARGESSVDEIVIMQNVNESQRRISDKEEEITPLRQYKSLIVVDHSTETSPQSSRPSFQFYEEEGKEEEDEEGGGGEEEEILNEVDDVSTTTAKHTQSWWQTNQHKIKVAHDAGEKKRHKKHGGKRHGHGHGGHHDQLHQQQQMIVEEAEHGGAEDGDDLVPLPVPALAAMEAPAFVLKYNPNCEYNENCIGTDFWSRHLSMKQQSEQEDNLQFYDNFGVEKPYKPLYYSKSRADKIDKTKAAPVEEFSWLPPQIPDIVLAFEFSCEAEGEQCSDDGE